MNRPMGMNAQFLEISPRDVTCFIFAVAVHSLLLLWSGTLLTMPTDKPGTGLGDMIVGVGYMSELPNYDNMPEGGGGGAPAPKKSLFNRMKSFIKGGDQISKGETPAAVPAPKPQQQPWENAGVKLTEKPVFKNGFKGLADTTKELAVSKGASTEVIAKPSQGQFKEAEPNLKENTFRVAKRDVHFPIVNPKSMDALANVNAIPVAMGQTTDRTIKSLDGGAGGGPSMQSKTFASKGGALSGAAFGSAPSSGGGKGFSGGIAMGGGGEKIQGGSGLASGSGSGEGSGSGMGGGNGSGNGRYNGAGSGNGAGRSWGGGSGTGTGMGGSGLVALPRNSAPAEMVEKHSRNSGFNITGALANRQITQKFLPAYDQSLGTARVALRFRVDFSGRVLDGILVEISSGSPSFDQKVMAELKKWQFVPLAVNRTNEIQEGVITILFKGV